MSDDLVLKPCPFCGGDVERVLPHSSDLSEYIRHKDASQCPVEFTAFTLDGGDAMATAWNTRQPDTTLTAERDAALADAERLRGVIIQERQDAASRYSAAMNEANRLDLIASGLEWRPLTDTVWLDGRDVVLLAYDMEVQARYCAGQWSDDTPINPREYDGAVWSCFDDEFQIEIEEISSDPADWHHGAATHWRLPTPRPGTRAAIAKATP